jgi:hypothetical protein
VGRQLFARVAADLNPPPAFVGAKLFAVHTLAGALVTLFCPQLGVGPILGGDAIMSLFMRFGHLWCAAFCGAIFFAASAGLSTLILKRPELRVASRYGAAGFTILAALTLAGLMLAGADNDRLSYLFWSAGAILSGWLVLTAGTRARLGRRLAY